MADSKAAAVACLTAVYGCHSRFTEALPSEPLGDLLWRWVVVERNGGLRRAMDDQGFVQVGLSIGQPLEQLVVHQHDWKYSENRNKVWFIEQKYTSQPTGSIYSLFCLLSSVLKSQSKVPSLSVILALCVVLSKHSTSATPPLQTHTVYLYFPSHPQLVHVGCRVVSYAGAVGSWRGVEQGGWVEQLRKAWWWVAGPEPAEIRSGQNEQPRNSLGGVFMDSLICVYCVGVVHWGVCWWRGCLCEPWVPRCWREQIQSGWSGSDTSTSAWMIQLPVRHRRHPCLRKLHNGTWMHHEHTWPWDIFRELPYLKGLPLLHWELAAVPGYEVIGAAVESLRWDRGGAAISVRKRDGHCHSGSVGYSVATNRFAC